ncbi:MAG: hypothetical protein M3N68_10680 [Actinomycetota bacterium]|nr:hypothetical protein [Actinomycetota bacterium]
MCSAAFLAVPLMLRGTGNFLDRDGFTLNGSRYTVQPILFLVVLALLVLDQPDPRVGEATWARVQCAFVILTVALVLVNYADYAVRTPAPSWQANLASARKACAGGDPTPGGAALEALGPEVSERVGANEAEIVIPISPHLLRAVPWGVVTTCERIR